MLPLKRVESVSMIDYPYGYAPFLSMINGK